MDHWRNPAHRRRPALTSDIARLGAIVPIVEAASDAAVVGNRQTSAPARARSSADLGEGSVRLLRRLDEAWAALTDSYAGLSDSQLTEPGVTGDWSVKDILAHVTTWEGEALKYLPLIIAGGRPPRYAKYGGIDAFNAKTTAAKRGLSLPEVLRQLDDTHGRLIDFVQRTPDAQVMRDTRFRRRLRLDTYGHYPEHAEAIRKWRVRRLGG